MALQDVWVKGLGKKRGAPHLFLDAAQAVRAGFAPGERFDVEVDGDRVTLTKRVDGSRTVSVRRRGEKELPVIDINSKELLAGFDGMDAVRVVVGHDCVYLLPLASEAKRVERLNRIRSKIAERLPLTMGSLSHGGGVLSHAIHQGLKDGGLDASLAFANEIREDLLEHAAAHNDAWDQKTAALAMPMQEIAQDEWLMARLPKLDILEMGLPCSGASKAGVAKRSLAKMEDHPEVGHLVHAALVILNKVQPVVVLLENVVDYSHSASAQILRHQMRDMGYDTHEAVLEGRDFGSLENRVRWCMVAVTRGVDFNFERLAPRLNVVKVLGDVIDRTIAEDDPSWSRFEHLKAKRERDEAKGSSFKMQFVDETSTSVPTLRKGYHKGGSTDPLLRHPSDPEKYRLLTEVEHALIKGVPVHLIEGLSKTIAHQLLGQGIVYEPFRKVGERIAQHLLSYASGEQIDESEGSSSEVQSRRQRFVG